MAEITNELMYEVLKQMQLDTAALKEGQRETNAALKPEVLFLLGFANFKMDNIVDALKFNQQCAAIKSRFQAQAAKNVAVIRSQYRAVQ